MNALTDVAVSAHAEAADATAEAAAGGVANGVAEGLAEGPVERAGPAAAAPAQPLPHALALLNEHLTALSQALQGRDAHALHHAADRLVAVLDAAAPALREPGALTPALRRQLAYAIGRVAAHREALARATASVDRAIEVLLPSSLPATGTYSAAGYAERAASRPASAWA